MNYEREPYDANGKPLYAERQQDPQTKFWKPTGIVRDREGLSLIHIFGEDNAEILRNCAIEGKYVQLN